MQLINNQYYFLKTNIFNLAAENTAVLIEKQTIEYVSIEKCCFNKCSSKTGPAAVLLDVLKLSLMKSSFVEMISKDLISMNSGASAKLFSNNSLLTFLSAIKCETEHHDNFHLSGSNITLTYLNNTHNKINHITFVYIRKSEKSDVSFCNVFHNPSGEGTEFQSSFANECYIHQCSFAYNTCSKQNILNLGVVRIFEGGTMRACELYFFKNTKVPLSQDQDGNPNAKLIAESIFTDNNNFYSVAPSGVSSISSLPIFSGENVAVACIRATWQHQQQCKLRLGIVACCFLILR